MAWSFFSAKILKDKLSPDKNRVIICCMLIAATLFVQFFYSYFKCEIGFKILLMYALFNVCINDMFINGPVVLGGDGYSGGFRKSEEVYM